MKENLIRDCAPAPVWRQSVSQIECPQDDSEQIIARALALLTRKLDDPRRIENPETMKQYARLRLSNLHYEVFAIFYMDTRKRVLAYDELFRGTIDGCSVHPREVVRKCLENNAHAVVFVHNHPSGGPGTLQRRQEPDHKAPRRADAGRD